MTGLAAIGWSGPQIAEFLSNLLLVFSLAIIVHILSSWLPRRPGSGVLRAILDFCAEVSEPYLKIFRSFIKPIGSGDFAMDLSPVIALVVLGLAGGFVIGAVAGT